MFNVTFRFNVAIKSLRKIADTNKTTNSNDNCVHATGSKGEDGNISTQDSDIDLLIDEAKTMLSVGTYHENIVIQVRNRSGLF